MWTRNYKNLIRSVIGFGSYGLSGVSSHAFGGDEYYNNFKAPNGSVYEIANTYHDRSSNYGCFTKPHFVITTNGSDLSASVKLTINQMANGRNSSGTVSEPNGANAIYVGFGSGTTAANEFDYCIEEMITTLTSGSCLATATLNIDGTVTVSYKMVVSASADCTISEIGLFKPTYYYTNSSEGSSRHMLINRIVLDEPISVVSGSAATITFSVTTPSITFSE